MLEPYRYLAVDTGDLNVILSHRSTPRTQRTRCSSARSVELSWRSMPSSRANAIRPYALPLDVLRRGRMQFAPTRWCSMFFSATRWLGRIAYACTEMAAMLDDRRRVGAYRIR